MNLNDLEVVSLTKNRARAKRSITSAKIIKRSAKKSSDSCRSLQHSEMSVSDPSATVYVVNIKTIEVKRPE